MATRGTLGLRMAQQLTLTPQLQQSLRLLQLSALELAQEVEQMLADNPLLELADDDTPDAPPPDKASAGESRRWSTRRSCSRSVSRLSISARGSGRPSASRCSSSTARTFCSTVSLRKIDASCGR
jgi:RNA polymerase sigma-54 factor